MLTKGIVITKNINNGKYLVRIPYLENAGRLKNCNIEATASVVPGISESFAPDDIVILGFEDHMPEKPIIIGKLFVREEEARGYAKISSLEVNDSAHLPENTQVGEFNLVKTLRDLIQRVQTIEDNSQNS